MKKQNQVAALTLKSKKKFKVSVPKATRNFFPNLFSVHVCFQTCWRAKQGSNVQTVPINGYHSKQTCRYSLISKWITELNKLPSLPLTQDITVQTQTCIQMRNEIKRLFLDHCSITEAAWHLFASALHQPSPMHLIPQANRSWHDLTFSLFLRPVD